MSMKGLTVIRFTRFPRRSRRASLRPIMASPASRARVERPRSQAVQTFRKRSPIPGCARELDSEKRPRSDSLTMRRRSADRSGSTIRLLTSPRWDLRVSCPTIAARDFHSPASVFSR